MASLALTPFGRRLAWKSGNLDSIFMSNLRKDGILILKKLKKFPMQNSHFQLINPETLNFEHQTWTHSKKSIRTSLRGATQFLNWAKCSNDWNSKIQISNFKWITMTRYFNSKIFKMDLFRKLNISDLGFICFLLFLIFGNSFIIKN
jgi:hypothetical protein